MTYQYMIIKSTSGSNLDFEGMQIRLCESSYVK